MNHAAPFAPRTVLLLVLGGFALFIALLWMIGTGNGGGNGDANDGGDHAAGRGLNGYAALVSLLDKRGYTVARTRTVSVLRSPDLLVLTPPARADADEIQAIITQRRNVGPTLLILPKWTALRVPRGTKQAKPGWVMLVDASSPPWADDLDLLKPFGLALDPQAADSARRWTGLGQTGLTAPEKSVQYFGAGGDLAPLVSSGAGGILAGYLDDGDYAGLAAEADLPSSDFAEEENRFPVVVVAEPDLLNNLGMADRARAAMALELVDAALNGEDLGINFDLTQSGYAAGRNLLTLAFTPPFLAATLCLILAALAVGWRAFARFGPARTGGRAIAFGKTALVGNAAGLIRRARRLHLLGQPYAAATRDRLVRALALPASDDPAMTEAAIDRALAARAPDALPYSERAAALRRAHHPRDLVQAAQDLHAVERILTR
jgi:hypothetical protein